jgi:hypothetical protein
MALVNLRDPHQDGDAMRRWLLDYAVPVGALLIGPVSSVLVPPTPAGLWAETIIATVLTVWFLAYAQGWRRAAAFVGIALAFSFCMEYTFVNVIGILTHYTQPQFAGVPVLAPLQDFLAVAACHIFACALLPTRGVLPKVVGTTVLMLIAMFVAGPWESVLGFYTYNAPFLGWGDSLGLGQVPPVPWAEPIGMSLLAGITTVVFEALASPGRARRPFSLTWAGVLYFGAQTLPAWAWAGYTARWGLFMPGTVLLAGLAIFALRAASTAVPLKQTPIEAEAQP